MAGRAFRPIASTRTPTPAWPRWVSRGPPFLGGRSGPRFAPCLWTAVGPALCWPGPNRGLIFQALSRHRVVLPHHGPEACEKRFWECRCVRRCGFQKPGPNQNHFGSTKRPAAPRWPKPQQWQLNRSKLISLSQVVATQGRTVGAAPAAQLVPATLNQPRPVGRHRRKTRHEPQRASPRASAISEAIAGCCQQQVALR